MIIFYYFVVDFQLTFQQKICLCWHHFLDPFYWYGFALKPPSSFHKENCCMIEYFEAKILVFEQDGHDIHPRFRLLVEWNDRRKMNTSWQILPLGQNFELHFPCQGVQLSSCQFGGKWRFWSNFHLPIVSRLFFGTKARLNVDLWLFDSNHLWHCFSSPFERVRGSQHRPHQWPSVVIVLQHCWQPIIKDMKCIDIITDIIF